MDLELGSEGGGLRLRGRMHKHKHKHKHSNSRSRSRSRRQTQSPTPKSLLEQQKEILAGAAEEAGKKIDYEKAHNEDILIAVSIVEQFLRDKHRICYGGQAMNMHLPAHHKFYDPETSLPDYDFLTPTGSDDVATLKRMLRKEGFVEVSDRQGIHEGTTKLYVNFTPVADITEINPLFYQIIGKRSIKVDGITYMDADTLRMMMYLELSRPRGEVTRWEKVFERLLLLNKYVPSKVCKRKALTASASANTPTAAAAAKPSVHLRQKILNFCVTELRVLAGADILDYYKLRLRKPIHVTWLFRPKSPIIFYSPQPEEDIERIHSRTGGAIIFKKYTAEAEFFPLIYIGYAAKQPVLAIIQETACHAYNTVQLRDGRALRIASMDTLITLYLSFLFRSSLQTLFLRPIGCMVEQMIQLQTLYRTNPKAPFPFISIECSGHQKSFASLLREKVARIHRLKTQKAARGVDIKDVKELPAIAGKSSTRKNKSQRDVHK
jgi:hypothetical protein